MARGRFRTAFVAGAIIGGAVGAAATLWRVPQSGRTTRAQIGGQLQAVAGPAAPALQVVSETLATVGDAVAGGVNGVTRLVEELIDPTMPGVASAAPDAAPDFPSSAIGTTPSGINVATSTRVASSAPVVDEETPPTAAPILVSQAAEVTSGQS